MERYLLQTRGLVPPAIKGMRQRIPMSSGWNSWMNPLRPEGRRGYAGAEVREGAAQVRSSKGASGSTPIRSAGQTSGGLSSGKKGGIDPGGQRGGRQAWLGMRQADEYDRIHRGARRYHPILTSRRRSRRSERSLVSSGWTAACRLKMRIDYLKGVMRREPGHHGTSGI